MYIQGGSYVMLWGWQDMVDFGSYTSTSRPVEYLYIMGLSFIDGRLEVGAEDWSFDATVAAVAWMYEAWRHGYGEQYSQVGVHNVRERDYMLDFWFESADFHVNW